MIKKLGILFLLCLTGCAGLNNNWLPSENSRVVQPVPTPRKSEVQTILDSWISRPASQLIQEWGLPDHQMDGSNNQKIYEYRRCTSPSGMAINQAYMSFISMSQSCVRWTFMISDGNIVQDRFTPE